MKNKNKKKNENKGNEQRITSKKLSFIAAAFIFVLTCAVYINSMNNKFTNWDDPALIVNNHSIRSLGVDNLKRIFNPLAGGTYQPIRTFSYAVDFYFFGLNPCGYHIQNILFHALAAVFLFLSLVLIIPQIQGVKIFDVKNYDLKSSGSKFRSPASQTPAIVIAMAFVPAVLFAIHPVNVEAVVWLSGRKYVLMAFFMFLSLYFFVRSSENGEYHFLFSAISLISAVLSVLSSPFGVAVPGLLFLVDYCRDENINPLAVLGKRIKYFIPYILFCLIIFPFLFMKLVGFGSGGGGAAVHEKSVTMMSLFYIILNCLSNYIKNLSLPLWLNSRYPDYIFSNPWHFKIILAVIGLVIISVFLVKQLKQGSKKYIFPFFWFVIAWLPASNIIPISTKMADRYIYIAGVGYFIFISFLLFRTYKKLTFLNKHAVKTGIVILVFFSCAVLTWQRNKVWKNSFTLWGDSVNKNPYNLLALTNLGSAYFDKGQYKKAVQYYLAASLVNPGHFAVHHNLGAAYFKIRQFKKAEAEYLRDIKINPDSALDYSMLANIYQKLGEENKSLFMYNKAVQLSKNVGAEVLYNMATFFAEQGKFNKAVDNFMKAIHKKPDYPEAYYDMGRVFHSMGKLDKAENYYKKAVELKNDYPEPYNSLGNVMLQKGKYAKAEKYYKKALELKKKYPEVYYNLGNCFVLKGNYDKALFFFEKALKLDPNYSAAAEMIRKIKEIK